MYIILEEIFLGGWRGYICAPNWKFKGGRGLISYGNNSLHGRGMDIFWNHILHLELSHHSHLLQLRKL